MDWWPSPLYGYTNSTNSTMTHMGSQSFPLPTGNRVPPCPKISWCWPCEHACNVCVWKNITSHYIMILQGNTLHFQHVLHFLTLRRIAFCDIALGWTTLNTYMLIYWHILTLWRYSAAHSIPFDSIPFNSILAELWWFTNLKIAVVIRPFGDD